MEVFIKAVFLCGFFGGKGQGVQICLVESTFHYLLLLSIQEHSDKIIMNEFRLVDWLVFVVDYVWCTDWWVALFNHICKFTVLENRATFEQKGTKKNQSCSILSNESFKNVFIVQFLLFWICCCAIQILWVHLLNQFSKPTRNPIWQLLIFCCSDENVPTIDMLLSLQ